ncbi:hypothetical protein Zmor_021366 [Zophobas morio]|uniref:Uncharacterized protein n=1 Tax=Zophobas morio TaxID=2755281 RepID=A0AA38I635_9CUCU|nr:hypothetical protein Zmor_021366 [Zophobas morio]
MCTIWDETTQDGLRRKFFHIASYELAWRGREAYNCLLSYFEEQFDSYRIPTGRIAYNPSFSNKTAQGGCQRLTEKRWLVQNTTNVNKCPITFCKLLKEKRGKHYGRTPFLICKPIMDERKIKRFFQRLSIRKRLNFEVDRAGNRSYRNGHEKNKSDKSLESCRGSYSSCQGWSFRKSNYEITLKSGFATASFQVDTEHHEKIIQQMRNNDSEITVISDESSMKSPSSLVSSKILYSN